MKRIRFIEKDWWIKRIKQTMTYINDEDIEKALPELDYVDLTFIFNYNVNGNGFTVKIIDNDTDKELMVNDLRGAAREFFLEQVKMISVVQQLNNKEYQKLRVNRSISEIKNMIDSWKKEKSLA